MCIAVLRGCSRGSCSTLQPCVFGLLPQICGCRLDRLLPQLRRDGRLLGSTADSLYKAAAGLQQVLRLSEEGVTLVARR